MQSVSDRRDAGEATSYWDSPFARLAHFGWLIIVLIVIMVIALATSGLTRQTADRPPLQRNR
ncbi:MAG: hypothetical protein HZA54_15810 [Planctomycetes bacterium]|nr:hypothetical protein [Planctomycetota bacterium]